MLSFFKKLHFKRGGGLPVHQALFPFFNIYLLSWAIFIIKLFL